MSTTPHDALAKTTFQRPELAAEEILHALGPRIARWLDPRSLTLVPGSFIAEDMRGRASDVLYTARMAEHEVFVYVLLEHQSSDDRWMPLRVLQYMVEIWGQYRRQEPKARCLPPILPVVLHHGDAPWRRATRFEALFELPAALAEDLLVHLPRFAFALDDLAAQSEEELRARPASAHLRLVLLALQHARSSPSIEALLRRLLDLMRELSRTPEGLGALREVFWYLFQVRAGEDRGGLVTVAAELRESAREDFMQTIAQWYEEQGAQRGRQEGLKEGLKEGRQQSLLRQLRLRFGELPSWVSARVAEAEAAQLEPWQDRVLFARSLDEVFAE